MAVCCSGCSVLGLTHFSVTPLREAERDSRCTRRDRRDNQCMASTTHSHRCTMVRPEAAQSKELNNVTSMTCYAYV